MLRKLLLLAGCVAIPSLAEAQSLPVGTRARVFQNGHWPVTGQVVESSSAGFAIDSAGQGSRAFYRYDQIQRLERSEGVKNHALLGGGIGFLAGAAFTVYFLQGFCGADSPCQGDEFARAGAIFVLPPTLAGLVIGSLIKKERWVQVNQPRLSLRVDSKGVGVGLSLRF